MKKLFFYLLLPTMPLGALAQGPGVTVKAAKGLPFISIHDGRSCQSVQLSLEMPVTPRQ